MKLRILIMAALTRMGAFTGIGALINKKAYAGGHLLEGGTYWKEDSKSNHYGSHWAKHVIVSHLNATTFNQNTDD